MPFTTISDVATGALTEIRSARAGDVVNPDDMDLALAVLNELLDAWNANRRAVVAEVFNDYTLTPALSPHTIGLGGTFNVASRPVSLEAAALNLGGTPNSFAPITVRDAAWYAQQPVPGLTDAVPTDVYYQPAWPLGKLYFFGIPNTAYGVRLWTRTLLAAVALTDTFSLPPGYLLAIRLSLAESLANAMGQALSPTLAVRADAARATIFGNNDPVPRIATQDAGVPSRGQPSAFNWLNRSLG